MTRQELQDALANNPQNIPFDNFDLLCSTLPTRKNVHIFDQIHMPQNYDEQIFGQWFPRRVISVGVPSRFSQKKTHRVFIEYLPTSWDLPDNFNNEFGFTQDNLNRILAYGCMKKCPIGYRQAGCCSHVAAAIILLGIYAYNPNIFETTHKNLHHVDPFQTRSLNQQMFG